MKGVSSLVRPGGQILGSVDNTLSRCIPGQDENSTAVMSAVVAACGEIRAHTGGAVLAVHHPGKEREKGLRGNTALLGALDFVIHATGEKDSLALRVEKQKEAELAGPFHFNMERLEWNDGSTEDPGLMRSTLVPIPGAAQDHGSISREQIAKAFDMIEAAWTDGNPLSHRPETKKDGRYAPAIFARRIGGEANGWITLLSSWLENRCLDVEMCDKRSKRRGLRVLARVE